MKPEQAKKKLPRLYITKVYERDKPLVVINAGKVLKTQSTLNRRYLGMKRCFTGDDKKRIGKLQYADGGTAIIDDAQDLHKDVQAKLLRASENGGIEAIRKDKGMKKLIFVI
ncbi:MAG: sigma 54-interacting transcriptional regulator [Bacteroidetes bacterium]|nr:sigma 54-interacting transcriptional regulator [Bacteroidota bacterium]